MVVSVEARTKQASAASAVFRQADKMAMSIGSRASRFIARGRIEDEGGIWSDNQVDQRMDALMPRHQRQWLQVGAHALVSQLLTVEEAAEVRRWFVHAVHPEPGQPQPQWYDEPGRTVIAGPCGVGKSVLAAAAAVEVVERIKQAGGKRRTGARGLLYCANSVALLDDFWRLLQAMGCDMGQVAARYGEKQHQPHFAIERTPDHEVLDRFAIAPVILVTQQWVSKLSLRADGVEVEGNGPPCSLADLLVFNGDTRAGIWDEAFNRHDVSVRFNSANLLDILSSIKHHGMDCSSNALLRTGALALQRVGSELLEKGEEARNNALGMASFVGTISKQEIKGLSKLIEELKSKRIGLSVGEYVIKPLCLMANKPQQVWSSPSTQKSDKVAFCQPQLKVHSSIERLVILDASYTVSLIREADASVQMASGMRDAADWLEPKRFDDVVIHIAHGTSGRSTLATDKEKRTKLIARQVQRILAHVPEDQEFLLVLFKQDEDDTPSETVSIVDPLTPEKFNWQELIETELSAQGVKDWKRRAQFLTWGQHTGRSAWRHIVHCFAFGVLQRDWDEDIRHEMSANAGAMHLPNPLRDGQTWQQAVIGEIAAAIQQLTGRLHCRITRVIRDAMNRAEPKGVSGESHLWIETCEQGTGGQSVDVDGDSYLCKAIREGMPGVQIVREANVFRPSPARDAANAGAEWLAALPASKVSITSKEVLNFLHQWMADNQIEAAQRTAYRAMDAIKLQALVDGWSIVGKTWTRPGAVPGAVAAEAKAVPATLERRAASAAQLSDLIIQEVLRRVATDRLDELKFAAVKGAVLADYPAPVGSSAWGNHRRIADEALKVHGVVPNGEGRAAKGWVRSVTTGCDRSDSPCAAVDVVG